MQKNYLKQQELQTKKTYSFKEKQLHISWCFKNNIIIYGIPTKNWNELQIQVNFKGNIITNHFIYKQLKLKPNEPKWWIHIQELYSDYYEAGIRK